jgi:hypothetical protein
MPTEFMKTDDGAEVEVTCDGEYDPVNLWVDAEPGVSYDSAAAGVDLTPTEARMLAEALLIAAARAEQEQDRD